MYVEKLAEMLAATRALSCVAVRLGITHGLGTVMKADLRFMTVPNRFAQLAAQGRPLTIHSGAVRPAGFIHLAEASAALRSALVLDLPTRYRAVNAVGECATVGEVAEQVRRAGQRRGLTTSTSGPSVSSSAKVSVETSLPTTIFRPHCRLASSIDEVLGHFLELS